MYKEPQSLILLSYVERSTNGRVIGKYLLIIYKIEIKYLGSCSYLLLETFNVFSMYYHIFRFVRTKIVY